MLWNVTIYIYACVFVSTQLVHMVSPALWFGVRLLARADPSVLLAVWADADLMDPTCHTLTLLYRTST